MLVNATENIKNTYRCIEQVAHLKKAIYTSALKAY